MDIVINLTPIIQFLNLPSHLMAWRFFALFGWIPIAITFLWGAKEVWLSYIRRQWGAQQKFILLAIDIPRGNEQTPRAVENLFAYLGGAHGTINLIEHYWEGKWQLYFSFEIVSLEGYTQFLIWTPVQFRDLVESAVYSQYPDAEIVEVDDYTKGFPTTFPDDEYDVYGWEFHQKEHPMLPIPTYETFEHQLGPPETQFKDPMASLMDMCSSLRKGEHFWYQIIVIPMGFDWPEQGEKLISEIVGESVKGDKNIVDKFIDGLVGWMGDFSEAIYQLWGDIPDSKEEDSQDAFRMLNLKPKEKKQIDAIQEKVSKLGFEFKIRMVYMAKKEVKNTIKVANGFVGFMKQFMSLDLNNLKPDLELTATKTAYFFAEKRLNIKKNNIVRNYIARDDWAGKKPGIFNVEELATIWHFPVEASVKAPLIQKAPGRKAEAPMQLPVGEETVSEEILEPIFEEAEKTKEAKAELEELVSEEDATSKEKDAEKKSAPPGNLPVV